MTSIIRADGLSKKYVIGHAREAAYGTLRDALAHGAKGLARRVMHPFARSRANGGAPDYEEFWALSDVSFEVKEGERLGIIGRNGAGKSTLLKILSRITEPTSGRVTIGGRVASLLEVGTGFHPELSGRENIFLNGAVLGMSRAEIGRKFDEIVAFAEIEKFLDTPVKRYSSGMYVRLAFAVAAHLEPEIMIVDEVLAVGDRRFQDKCLGRMESMSSREGRTVVFVSHDLDAIQRLCHAGLYLNEGRIAMCGSIQSVVAQYVASTARAANPSQDLGELRDRWGTGRVRITGLGILSRDGVPVHVLHSGEDYEFVLSYVDDGLAGDIEDANASVGIANSRGVTVLLTSTDFEGQRLELRRGRGEVGCRVRDVNLAPGEYTVTLYIGRAGGETLDCLKDVVRLSVIGGDYFGTGHPGLPEHCSTLTRSTWRVRP